MKDEVLEYLDKKEIEIGAKRVRESCRKYMTKKTHAGTLPTIRKPIPKRWTLEAWAKQNGICPRCKQKIEHSEMSGDHIKPLADGERTVSGTSNACIRNAIVQKVQMIL